MNKTQEALKMAIEGMAKAEKIFDDLGLLLIKFGVNPSDINFHKESFLAPAIQACKEALKPHPNCDEACMFQCQMERKEALAELALEQMAQNAKELGLDYCSHGSDSACKECYMEKAK